MSNNTSSNDSNSNYSLLAGLSTVYTLETNPAFAYISLAFNFSSTCLVIYMAFFKINVWSMVKFKSDEYYRLRVLVILGSVLQRFSHLAMQVGQYALPTNHTINFLTLLNILNLLYNLASTLILSLFILMTMSIFIRLETIAPNTTRNRKFVIAKNATYMTAVIVSLLYIIRFIERQVDSNFMDDPTLAPSPVFEFIVINSKDLIEAISLVIEIIFDFIFNSKMIIHSLKHIEEKVEVSPGNGDGGGGRGRLSKSPSESTERQQATPSGSSKASSLAMFIEQTRSVVPFGSSRIRERQSAREAAAFHLKRRMILSFLFLMLIDIVMILITVIAVLILILNGTETSAIYSSWCTFRVFAVIQLLDAFLAGLKDVGQLAIMQFPADTNGASSDSNSKPHGTFSSWGDTSNQFYLRGSYVDSDPKMGHGSDVSKSKQQGGTSLSINESSMFTTNSNYVPTQAYQRDYSIGK